MVPQLANVECFLQPWKSLNFVFSGCYFILEVPIQVGRKQLKRISLSAIEIDQTEVENIFFLEKTRVPSLFNILMN